MRQILVGLCFSAVFLFALNTTNADQRDPELDILFSKLKSAETIEDAEQISGRIWQIWATHNASSILSRQMQMGIDLMQSSQLDAANAVFSYVIQQDNEFAEAPKILGDDFMNELKLADVPDSDDECYF